MKLIVGLGNPGRKYAATRHNVGFEVLAILARRHGLGSSRRRFQGETVDALIGTQRVLLLCPHTYMNRSGLSVQQARDFYKVENSDILVVCDDINLPLGKLRLRAKGSAGGQKGLLDTIRCLGTDQVARLRVGIGSPPEGWDAADYVLAKFSPGEREMIDRAVERAADAAADWTRLDIETCMSRYNAGPSPGRTNPPLNDT